MKKRIFSIMLSLCLILTMLMSIPVSADVSLTIDKLSFTAGETVKFTIPTIPQQLIDDGAFIAIEKANTKPENAAVYEYISDMPSGNIYEFKAPVELGEYDLFLMDLDYKVLGSIRFKVESPKAQLGDITVSKPSVKLNEPMSVTVKGLTDEQIENSAWLGISNWNEKLNNTVTEAYISDLPVGNTYQFKAPDKFGKYQIRVFTDSNSPSEKTLFGTLDFTVESSKAQPGDIVLSKTSVFPEEKMSVTVKGLTQGEIDADAWIGIAKSEEKLENTVTEKYISDLPVNNTLEFTAPSEPGTYDVRVFCASNLSTPEEYEYGKFGVAQFIVSGEVPAGEDIVAGYEGLHGWAASEVNAAVDQQLVTEKIMVEFPKEITREEFCELAVLLYEKMTGAKAAPEAENPFTDTNNPEILKASKLKIVGGIGDGKFAPNNKVTREQISAMLLRTLQAAMPNVPTAAQFKTKFHDEKNISAWALEAVRFMNANGIVNGSTLSDGTSYILPQGNTTREQAIMMVLRLYNAFYKI